ncbi:MAG: hypothetical protein JY451_02255 [Erythrobacter sp.]|nr:MAG: hypothetical protein JY451_02255 [Erythrobacter sp.]
MVIDPRDLLRNRAAPRQAEAVRVETLSSPLGGTRAERIQRLQVGLFGVLSMVLLIGLADVVISRAQLTEASAVPEAAPTVVAEETDAPRDPLADAGVVPALPPQPTASPTGRAAPRAGDIPGPESSAGQNAPLQ